MKVERPMHAKMVLNIGATGAGAEAVKLERQLNHIPSSPHLA